MRSSRRGLVASAAAAGLPVRARAQDATARAARAHGLPTPAKPASPPIRDGVFPPAGVFRPTDQRSRAPAEA